MIETTNLTKRYGELTAVDSVDLTVERGDIHGFVGPNGAGKSTTMQMLVGLVSPSEGEATIGGEPAGSLAASELIGYAPQEPAFYESMTGLDYLVYMGKTAGMSGDIEGRARELLERFDLTDAARQPIGGYSGGMARKLSLAQAMIHEPELLILDEPTATLDPEGRAAVIDSLEAMTDEGMTVFVSSHVLAELEQFIDTVTILVDGKVATSGPVGQIQDRVAADTYRVDSTDNDRLADILAEHDAVERVTRAEDGSLRVTPTDGESFTTELQRTMADAGITMQSLEQEGGLEEAFLDLLDEAEAEPASADAEVEG